MAISITIQDVKKKFVSKYWNSFEEFESFYLQRIRETRSDTIYYTDESGSEKVLAPINHFPELKEYEVWSEGYAATGESGMAQLFGKAKARNFGQACHIVMCKNKLAFMEKENNPEYKEYSTPARWDYDPVGLSYWGCALYWSKALASKAFG